MEGRGGRPSKRRASGAGARQQRRDEAYAEKQATPLTRLKVEQMALAYVNRFDCTASKLRQHLTQRVRKLGGHEEAPSWIAELIERYLGSGVLNDARFAKNLASQLSARGKSSRAISQKLSLRGVPAEVAGELMTARKHDEPEAELEAARAYLRKRRMGPHRSAEKRAEYHQKDLASLARQGFSFDVAKRALGGAAGSDDDF